MSAKLRTFYIILFDYITLLLCYFACLFVSPDYILGHLPSLFQIGMTLVTLLVVYPCFFAVTGVYKIIHRYAQASEYLRFAVSFVGSGLIFGFITILEEKILHIATPYSTYFLVLFVIVSTVAMILTRILYEVVVNRSDSGEKKEMRNTLIVGCGQACLLLLNEVKYHAEHGIKPIVAVDSDPSKVGRTISGVKIEGTDDDIKALIEKHDIDLVIVAIPSATNSQRANIIEKCGSGIEIKMLPRVSDFNAVDSNVVDKLRDFTMDELLGRDPIEISHEEVDTFIRGKTVLVTGGGGSIGSELARQIAANSPKQLIIVDIYENNAYDIQQELNYVYGNSLNLKTIIASVRDFDRINHIFNEYKPQIVIHAAAHKHVPLMENSPQEAIKNNVCGTYNTARAAIENGVEKFILISTDKAVNPTNIMGASKRMCEMVIQSLNGKGTAFSAVRFGNVLGSNGSVIPLFKKQIENGGPVTVTHKDIIRYFMTIPEAVRLVLLASTKAKGGEIFVLNMGSPVKIDDLAKKMIAMSGKDIKIEYTGLRPGEKLYEELMMSDEHLQKTENDKIFIGKFIDFNPETIHQQIEELNTIANNNALSAADMLKALEVKITEIVPTFHRTPQE